MSSRHLRKLQQQKDLEEANRKLQAAEEEEEAESEEETVSKAPPKSNPAFSFAALNQDDNGEEGEDEKGGGEENSASPDELSKPELTPTAAAKAKKSKKKKKKSKANAQLAEKQESESDEIEAALRELNLKAPTAASGSTVEATKPTKNQQWDRICALLAVQTQHLKVANEMRMLFGRAATVSQEDRGGAPNQAQDLESVLKGRPGKRLPELTLRRNTLIQGKETWPQGTTGGLSMEMVEDLRHVDGTVEFRLVHNKSYQALQVKFNVFVEMGDPQRLVSFLGENPYHISALIQVSKIAKDQGDHALSSDLLERALFTFGRAGLSLFNTTLAAGKARLDFHRPENRELWLAGYQYIKSLIMKGTYRTAFEWAKLLLGLDPEEDPYCMRLMIHHLALKAHQFSWLLEIGDITLDKGEVPIYNKSNYDMYHNTPSLAFSALQLRDQSTARDLLSRTMRRLPWLFVRLFQELNLDAPHSIWGIQPRTDAENLYTSLYIQQTKDLWNTPEATALLMEIAHTIPKVDANSIEKVDNSTRTLDVVRFVYLDNTPALMSLVPSNMLHKANTSDSDPIPPDENVFSYPSQRTALEGSVPTMGFGDQFNPLAGLRGLIPGLLQRHAPRGSDDDDVEEDSDLDFGENPETMREALENSDDDGRGMTRTGLARRILRFLWRTGQIADDDEDLESEAMTGTDEEMPELVGERDELPGGDTDEEMPGLVDLDDASEDDEMPPLVPFDSIDGHAP